MADALISMVTEQFFCYVQEEFGLVVGVREQVGKLSLTLRMIQGVLQDAEQKQVKNNAVKVWLGELRDVLYEADDVMDKWNTELAVSRLQSQQVDVVVNPSSVKKVLSYLLCPRFNHITVRYDIGHRIKEIGERLDDINAKRSQFGLVDSPSQDHSRRITSSIIDVSTIHGRDQDKKIVVSWLLGDSSHQENGVQVVSIVGVGGFGKTTLAKLVLKEEGIIKHFDKKMWVCVSEPFDLFGVAKAIIEEAKGYIPTSVGWEATHQCLCDSVRGKRYLLVLDDVWTNDPNHWDPLKVSLDGGAPGSRIIVTTRNEEVAKMMGSSHIRNLEKLSESDSWSLLRDIALKGRTEECEKFEKVGKEIASKCKGVPLALSTLASLLRVKTTVQHWRDILANDIWVLSHIEDFLLPSLFLSYFSLPSVSKQCFLYCAVFPKDTEMEKDVLVKLWMAEGFFGSAKVSELERVGEDHFDNLAMRSFFQDFEKDSNGNITSCKMHDLVHDFAVYLSQGECTNDAKFDCNKVRYLCSREIEDSSLYEAKKGTGFGTGELEKLPEAVEKFVHLRYLDLSYTSLLELPETICNLYNLQTLRLNWCANLHKLPEDIGRLPNLRHLEMIGTRALYHLPRSVKTLSSLRTLSIFIVSVECKIGDLKHLNNLRGALELTGLSRMTDENDAVQADLKKKKDLRCLTLDWNVFRSEENWVDAATIGMENIFERLEPHEDLEELNVGYYPGSQFPRWFGNSSVLGNIVKMEINDCHKCTQLPALGKLASLERLEIFRMGSVKYIGRDFYGFDSNFGTEMIAFPKLKKLSLGQMGRLEGWELPISKHTKIMPSLTELRLRYWPKLKALPCLGKLESLEILELCRLDSVKQLDNQSVQQEVLEHFTTLQELEITYCPRLGGDWRSILGHVPKITINGEEITKRS